MLNAEDAGLDAVFDALWDVYVGHDGLADDAGLIDDGGQLLKGELGGVQGIGGGGGATIAEGNKEAAILQAEGQRTANILEAEGHRQAQILQAEGFSQALDRINQVASSADTKTMSLQYFETLKIMGQGQSTKWIFPMEFTNMLRPFLNLGDRERETGEGTS